MGDREPDAVGPDLTAIKNTIRQLAEWSDIPAEQFPGHKGIACANLEGWLGSTVPALVAEIERLRASHG